MSDLTLPLTVAGSIGLAVVGAGRAMWRHVITAEKRCDERMTALTERMALVESKRDDCEDRLRREIQLGAQRALMARNPEEPPPDSLPPPEWEESTGVRHLREVIEKKVLLQEAQRYAVRSNAHKALVIDDEHKVAEALHRALLSMLPASPPWEVAHEVDSRTGLSILLLDEDIILAIVDLRMPGLGGIDLIEEAVRSRPELRGRIIACTGVTVTRHMRDRLSNAGAVMIDKADAPVHLRDAVSRILAQPLLRQRSDPK